MKLVLHPSPTSPPTPSRRELHRMLSFLGVNASRAALTCTLANREGPYHRRGRRLTFDPFSVRQRQWIRSAARRVDPRMGLPVPHNNGQRTPLPPPS